MGSQARGWVLSNPRVEYVSRLFSLAPQIKYINLMPRVKGFMGPGAEKVACNPCTGR